MSDDDRLDILAVLGMAEKWSEFLFLDGYDDCITGLCQGAGRETVIAYDLERVLGKLVAGGLSHADAEEFWAFNMYGANFGPLTPVFVTLLPTKPKGE